MVHAPEDLTVVENRMLELIQTGRFPEAQKSIHKLSDKSTAEKRLKLYLKSQLLFQQGRYEDCLEIVAEALCKYEAHISLLLTRALSFYALGHFSDWVQSALLLEEEFLRVSRKIQPERAVQIRNVLARFMERGGDIAKAVYYLEESARQGGSASMAAQQTSLAHLLKLKIRFRQNDEVTRLSRILAKEKAHVDVDYARKLADAYQKSLQGGTAYLHLAAKIEPPAQCEMRIPYFELVEESLLTGKRLRQKTKADPRNAFERVLEQLYDDKLRENAVLQTAQDCRDKMPFGYYLTMMVLFLREPLSLRVKSELVRRVHIMLDGLSRESKRLWMGRVGDTLVENSDATHAFRDIVSKGPTQNHSSRVPAALP